MTTADDRFYERALARIYRAMWWLAALGAAVVLAWRGWPWCLGFLAGAGIAMISFRWIHKVADSLGPGGKPRKATAVFLGLRYLLFGTLGYVIVNFFGVAITSILLGLLVPVAAILAEIAYEIIYARA